MDGIKSFSKWFKVLFAVMCAVYISLWIFTILLSGVQKENGIEPRLPAAPKDSQGYVDFAESLMQGRGLANADGRIETLRTPAYPVFVAILRSATGTYFSVTFLQIFIVFASALLIRKIGIVFSADMFGRKVGEIAAALFLVSPVTMTLAVLILTDTLFLLVFAIAFYKAIQLTEEKWIRQTILISVLFAIAIYIRGMGLFALPVFLALVIPAQVPLQTKLKSMALMLVCIVISLTPWIMRNYVYTGVAGFNSFESVNLSWIVPKFIAEVDGTDEEVETKKFQRATGVPEAAWHDFSWQDIRYSKQINPVGEKLILERPFSYIKFHLVTSIPFLFPSSILFARDAYDSAIQYNRPFVYGSINALTSGDFKLFFTSIVKDWWKFTERMGWLFGIMLGLYAVWADRRRPYVWVFLFIIAYLMVLSGPAAGPRLSFQAWPYMFLLFAYGGIALCQKIRSHFRNNRG